MAKPPLPPPHAASPVLALAALDQAILRFWEDFVRRQLALGRRDVGSMLETTLGFFFEHTLQSAAAQQAQQQLKLLALQLQQELQRVAASLAAAAHATALLATPYQAQLAFSQAQLDQAPSTLQPLLQRLAAQALQPCEQRSALQELHNLLETALQQVQQQQHNALQQQTQQRQALAQRLKMLSPELYRTGQLLLHNSLVQAAPSAPAARNNAAATALQDATPAPPAYHGWRALWHGLQCWWQPAQRPAQPVPSATERQTDYAALAATWLQSYERFANQAPANIPPQNPQVPPRKGSKA